MLLECIPLSQNSDVGRFLKIYENLFKAGKLKRTNNFEISKNKIKLLKQGKEAEKEAKEAEEEMDKLTKAIMLNNKKRQQNDILEIFAKKYCGNKAGFNENFDINDEEFEKMRKNICKKKGKTGKRKKC